MGFQTASYKIGDNPGPRPNPHPDSQTTPSQFLYAKDKPSRTLQTIWTATLTVRDTSPSAPGSYFGCNNATVAKCDDLLTDGEFSYGPTFYIEAIEWLKTQSVPSFSFGLTTEILADLREDLIITVGSREFAWSAGALGPIESLNWSPDPPNTVQVPEIGDRVRLSLKAPLYKSSGDEKYPSNDPPTQRLTGPDAPPPEPVLFPNQKDCKIPCKETQSHGVRFIEFTNADEDTERQRKHNYYAEHYGDDWMTTCDQTRCGSILMLDGTTTYLQ